MPKILGFGETLPEYEVPVLNEREVRAAAGILFMLALVSFMNSWLLGNFQYTRLFVVAFLIDFSIRVLVNPRYAPSMIVGRLAVGRQAPEWVGAPQKRFAWGFAMLLALTMFWLIVVNHMIGPLNLLICATCLTLMFFESAFGVCLACKVYELFLRDKARYCPGGVCDIGARHPSQKVGITGMTIVVAFVALVGFAAQRWVLVRPEGPTATAPAQIPGQAADFVATNAKPGSTAEPAADDPCKTVPDWAVKMGHAAQWKLHHNCPGAAAPSAERPEHAGGRSNTSP